VRALIATAQARVLDRFGVELRREVEYLHRELAVPADTQVSDE
jgi:UDP-N-acetylenolpyruvoylglucosamine reductase